MGWLGLLLVLYFALRGFSSGTLVFPSPSNSSSTRNQVSKGSLSTRYRIEYFQLHIGLFPSLTYFECSPDNFKEKVAEFGGHSLNAKVFKFLAKWKRGAGRGRLGEVPL